MDPADLQPLLEQLDDNIDDLEEVLQPILANSLLKSAGKLPVMDRAKLQVLITYTLESLIFCTSQPLGRFQTPLTVFYSLFEAPWRGCEAALGVPGTDPRETVL
jgi:hypothetical protein